MKAVTKVARLAMEGRKPVVLETASRHLIAAWKREGIGFPDLRERIEAFQALIDNGMVLVDDFVSSAEEGDGARMAEAQRDALLALRAVVAAELEEMSVLL